MRDPALRINMDGHDSVEGDSLGHDLRRELLLDVYRGCMRVRRNDLRLKSARRTEELREPVKLTRNGMFLYEN